ncbi:MAG TPA: hypothetical protein VG184_12115 [Acidimicrobiales bacterium]|jgi:hypothetical protein|nr:hypothetical protein [Acidimicrobiales bacterium]
MGDFIIRTGDMLKVTIAPPAIVPMLIPPVPMLGTGTTVLAAGPPICLMGDQIPPELLEPMPYTAPPFVTPGMGTLQLILMPNNWTIKTLNGKVILLKGAMFEAMFNVTVPAIQPSVPPVPDPLVVKPGTAEYITTNVTVMAG